MKASSAISRLILAWAIVLGVLGWLEVKEFHENTMNILALPLGAVVGAAVMWA